MGSSLIKFAVTLGLFCIVAAFALGGVYELTKDKIAFEKERVMQEALKGVLPQAKTIVKVDTKEGKTLFQGFPGKDAQGAPVGYAVLALGKGYSSTIQTLVGLTPGGEICGITILYQQETPGLGTKAVEVRYGETDAWFQRQFLGKKGADVAVNKDGGIIQSITGATISSRAIASAVRNEVQWLRKNGYLTDKPAAPPPATKGG